MFLSNVLRDGILYVLTMQIMKYISWSDRRKSSPVFLSPLDVLLTKDPNQLSLLQVFNDLMKIQKVSLTLPHLTTYITTALPIFLSFYLLLRLHSSSFSSSALNCEWFFIFFSLIQFFIVIIALKAFFLLILIFESHVNENKGWCDPDVKTSHTWSSLIFSHLQIHQWTTTHKSN